MAEPVNWAILGAAKFARDHMGPAIHAARGARLAAIGTSDPAKAAPFEALAPGLRVHEGYEAVLADPDVDAVYVPLPNHLHVEWALRALDAGKHVLVEKPLGMVAKDFDAVIVKRDATGLLAAEAYMIVHHPQFQRAREILRAGDLGDLVHVDVAFSYNNAAATDNIRNRPETGGGVLPDIGVYAFGAARYLTGEEPEAIEWADIRRENGVDVHVRTAARFPSCTYQAVVSMRMAPRQHVTVQGTDAWLRLSAPFNAGVYGEARLEVERGTQVTTERWPMANHYVHQVEAFGRAIREGAAWPCPLEFSRGTQAMIDAVYATAGGA